MKGKKKKKRERKTYIEHFVIVHYSLSMNFIKARVAVNFITVNAEHSV